MWNMKRGWNGAKVGFEENCDNKRFKIAQKFESSWRNTSWINPQVEIKRLQIENDELHELVAVYKFQCELLISHAKWSHDEIVNTIKMEHQAAVQKVQEDNEETVKSKLLKKNQEMYAAMEE